MTFYQTCLPEAKRESCESPLTLDEAIEIERQAQMVCRSRLGPLLAISFNECLADGVLCDSMKTSVRRLVNKKDDNFTFECRLQDLL